MSALLKISNLARLFLLALFIDSPAHAEETLSYHLETALDDGYYGYAARTPENYRFVMVKDGEPVIFYPKNSGRTSCPPNSGGKEFFFSMGTNGKMLRVKQGSAYAMPSPYQKNQDSRMGTHAAVSEVQTDQHYPCSGKIVRD